MLFIYLIRWIFNEKENIYVNCEQSNISKKFIEVFAKKEAAIKMLGWSMSQAALIDTFSDKFLFKVLENDSFFIVICSENKKVM